MTKPGDKVLIKTKNKEYTGILMPRPELLEKGITILKLDNGYNIGIDNKKIKGMQLIKEYKQTKKKAKTKKKHDKSLPTVSILSFGGTISSKVDYTTGGASADYTAEDFIEMAPELEHIANLQAKKVMGIMSEDMNPEDWVEMAKHISKELSNESIDGIVVTQGTDTLHFSTAAMSFMLKNLTKPVIFTASQRSIDRGSTDAFMNLICAVNAAANFDGAVVATCMHASINDDDCLLIRGTKVRKMHTSRRDAFRPINELPLAKISKDKTIKILNQNYRKKRKKESYKTTTSNFEKKTGLIHVYPGMNPEMLDHFIEKNYKGIVIAATALGHIPVTSKKYSLLPKLKKLKENKCAIVIASQTIYGRTHPFVYTNLRKLSVTYDCIFAQDMLPEVAYAKLGWVLAQTANHEEVKKLILTNIAGEITSRSDVASFLY